MAICAPNYTFGNFSFCLSNAFGVTNIKHFFAFNMVKMQSGVVSFISTVNTTIFQFIIPKPLANLFSSIISLLVDSLPIFWFHKPSFSHYFALYRVIFSVARYAIRYLHFVRISFTPSLSGFSLFLFLKFCFHNYIIQQWDYVVNTYPCKPDIFEQTYKLWVQIERSK